MKQMKHIDTPTTRAISLSLLEYSASASFAVEVISGDESWKLEAAIGPEVTSSMLGIDKIRYVRENMMSDSLCSSCCIVESRGPDRGKVISNLKEPAQISTLT